MREEFGSHEAELRSRIDSSASSFTHHHQDLDKAICVLLLILDDTKRCVQEIEDKVHRKDQDLLEVQQEAAKLRELEAYDRTLLEDTQRSQQQQDQLASSLRQIIERARSKEATIEALRRAEGEDELFERAIAFASDRRHHRWLLRQSIRHWHYHASIRRFYQRGCQMLRAQHDAHCKAIHWNAWRVLTIKQQRLHRLQQQQQLRLQRHYWQHWRYQLMFEEFAHARHRHRLLYRCYQAWSAYRKHHQTLRVQAKRIMIFQQRCRLRRCLHAWRASVCFVGSMHHPLDEVAGRHHIRSIFLAWRQLAQSSASRLQQLCRHLHRSRLLHYYWQWKVASYAVWHRRRHLLRLFYRRLHQLLPRRSSYQMMITRSIHHYQQQRFAQAIYCWQAYNHRRKVKSEVIPELSQQQSHLLRRCLSRLSRHQTHRRRIRKLLHHHQQMRLQCCLHHWLHQTDRRQHSRSRAHLVHTLVIRKYRLREVFHAWQLRFYSSLRQRYQLVELEMNYQSQIRALHDKQLDELARGLVNEDQRLASMLASKQSLTTTLQSKEDYLVEIDRSCAMQLEIMTMAKHRAVALKSEIDELRQEESELLHKKSAIEHTRRQRQAKDAQDQSRLQQAEAEVQQLQAQVDDFETRIASLQADLSLDAKSNQALLSMSEETMTRMNALLQAQATTIAQLSAEEQDHARQLLEIMLRAEEMRATAADMLREKDQEIRHKTATVHVLTSEIGKSSSYASSFL
jgi:hypothetical protein